MKSIVCEGKRVEFAESGMEANGFRYRPDFEWAKWPDGLRGTHTLTGRFDANGDLYVATEDKEHPIVIFSAEGEYRRSIGAGLFQKAHSIFLTPSDTILVADSSKNSHVVREITKEGDLVHTFGREGIPGDSGYDFDYLSVLQAENRVPSDPVWNKRAAANARLDSIVRRGEPFCRPCSMIMNAAGEYFAADGYGNAAVHKFDRERQPAVSWGMPGNEPGHFRLVHDIHADCRDRLWVSDRENSRVQIFDMTGCLLAVIAGNLMRIGGVWTDDQYAYIGELDGGVTILDLDLHVLAQIGCKGSVIHAHGITGDGKGNLYIFTNKKNETNILRLERY